MEALKTLISVNESIFDSLVYISKQSELKEWNNSVTNGETHNFDFDIFTNSSDTIIQLLIILIEQVDETFNSLTNINGNQLG